MSDKPNSRMMQQAVDGEFDVHSAQAAGMTAREFAAAHGTTTRGWGYPSAVYDAVNVDGVDYLWRVKDGKFDGWDMAKGPL